MNNHDYQTILFLDEIYSKINKVIRLNHIADDWHRYFLENLIQLSGTTRIFIRTEKISGFLDIEYSKTDSAVFKKKIANLKSMVINKACSFEELCEYLDEAKKKLSSLVDCCMILIDSDSFPLVEAIQLNGGVVYNTNLTWLATKATLNKAAFKKNNDYNDCWITQKDEAKFMLFFEKSFSKYKSHFSYDSLTSNRNPEKSYYHKIKEHISNQQPLNMIVDKQERWVAFSSISEHKIFNDFCNKNYVAEIELSGIDREIGTIDAYKESLVRCLHYLTNKNFSFVVVNCISTNYSVQAIWSQLSAFSPALSRYRMHWWVKK